MIFKNKSFDEERALYGTHDVKVEECRFDGPADGESALKESTEITAFNCYFNLRYPFWHDKVLNIDTCEMTSQCRAALWYSDNIHIKNSKLHGIKALRECTKAVIEKCDIISPEFGWFNADVSMFDTSVTGEYFMLRSKELNFSKVKLDGKYSFQYIENSVFDNCVFNTKDAFWHARNVTVRDSEINGEYLGWYSENLTFENCVISGTQPLCYCKNLTLKNCIMKNTDLAFEKSDVQAEIISDIESIKNPKSGRIAVKNIGEVIIDDKDSNCNIIKLGN